MEYVVPTWNRNVTVVVIIGYSQSSRVFIFSLSPIRYQRDVKISTFFPIIYAAMSILFRTRSKKIENVRNNSLLWAISEFDNRREIKKTTNHSSYYTTVQNSVDSDKTSSDPNSSWWRSYRYLRGVTRIFQKGRLVLYFKKFLVGCVNLLARSQEKIITASKFPDYWYRLDGLLLNAKGSDILL